MSLDEKQQQWFQGYLGRQHQEADNLPQEPQPNPGESRASDGFQQRVKAYREQLQSLGANPIVAVKNGVKAAMADDAIPDPNADDQTRARFSNDTQTAIDGMAQTAKDGTSLNIGDIVKMPSLDAGSLISNPSSLLSMLNPLSWLAPMGDMLTHIPIVHRAMVAIKELLAGAKDHGFDIGRAWDRAGVRTSLEDAFSAFPEQQRAAMIDKAMDDYQQHSGAELVASPVKSVNVTQGEANNVSLEFIETRGQGAPTIITETGQFDKDKQTITFGGAHYQQGNQNGDLQAPDQQKLVLKVDPNDIGADGKLKIDDTLKAAALSQASALESLIPSGTPATQAAGQQK